MSTPSFEESVHGPLDCGMRPSSYMEGLHKLAPPSVPGESARLARLAAEETSAGGWRRSAPCACLACRGRRAEAPG